MLNSTALASIKEDNLFLRIQDHLLVVTPGSDPVGALNSAFAFEPEHVQYREERATAAASRHTNQAGLFTLSLDQTSISIQQYIEICLEHWWFENRRRHLPLFIDGCTPVRRTVLAVMLGGRGDQTTVVSDLAGIICDATDSRHKTEGVAQAIIALGQSDLGTNNFPLLKGQSGFGSKLRAPAKPHYLKVQRSPVARQIFSPLLNSDRTRGKVVPDFLLPSLPLQFVNGGEGLANHRYPSFAVADLKGNVLRRLRGQPLLVMTPQWKGYVGTVERSSATYYTLTPPSAAITGKKGRNVIQGFSARLVALGQDGRVLRFDGPEVMLEAWVDTVLDCLVAQNNLTREQAIFIWIELLEAMPDDLSTEEEEEQQQPQQQSQQQQQLPQSPPRSPVVRWAAAEPGGAMAADRAAAAGDDDHFDDVDWPAKTELNETAGQLEDQLKRQLSEKEVELSQTLLRCEKEAAARAAAEKTLREREEELEHQKSVFEQTLNCREKTLRRQLDKIDDKLSREQSKRRKAERDLEEAIEANELLQKEIEILKKRRG